MTTFTELVEQVLAGHQWKTRASGNWQILVCACGDELIPRTSSAVATLADHRSHVAGVIAAAVEVQEYTDYGLQESDGSIMYAGHDREFALETRAQIPSLNDAQLMARTSFFVSPTEWELTQ